MPTASTDFVPLFLERLRSGLTGLADPARAASMRRYMKDQFAYLGVPGPLQDSVFRNAIAGLPKPSESEVIEVARALWREDAREYQYAACGLLRRSEKLLTADALPVLRELVLTKSWWDTVDALASHPIGAVVRENRERLSPVMVDWAEGDEPWLARAAILHQLRYKGATDEALLFGCCLARAGDPWFFSRKAIGWALREYAKTDPDAVRRFVAESQGVLSALSKREALRRLG